MSPPGDSGPVLVNYEQLVATHGDVSTVVDLRGRFVYCSAALQGIFGWPPGELVGSWEDDFVHPDDAPALVDRREASSPQLSTSYRFRCRDGSYVWVEATSRRTNDGGTDLIVNSLHDITERRRQTIALEVRATTDPLTGVANRTVLMDRLHQGLRRLVRSPGTVLAVLYLDLDRFKIINDSLGHSIGDDVLLKMAERLTHHLRPADTLARLGGDEFVLVAE
ncbi:MAG TPA: GGDEF domain-containing protein, partial [Acidimicrobiales bacterium]|nr:GGDEF domain-containing protein [Acidimicrobiales bacterium]